MKKLIIAAGLAWAGICPVRAHHGLDFMLVQDAALPAPFSAMLYDNSEWSTASGADEYSTEPGILMGVTPWLAIGANTSFMDEGEGWDYLSTTPYINFPLFKSDRVPWLRVSLYAGYEIATDRGHPSGQSSSVATGGSGKRSKSSSAASTGSGSSGKLIVNGASKKTVPANPKVQRHNVGGGGPDAPTGGGGGTDHNHPVGGSAAPQTTTVQSEPEPVPVAPVESFYQGIHRHGEEGLHARLIIDADLGSSDKIVANVINFTPRYGPPAWGYALGYRHSFHHDLAASLEAVGDFDGRGSHEALVAAHYSLTHHLTLKLGVGVGLTESSPDASVHAGVVWRF